MVRKLASIQKILELNPIPNADAIECAKVLGWNVVVKKGEFKVGDSCVYFEVDSFLPLEPQYEFLRASSYRNNEFMGQGYRLKTVKLRGQVSQGLVLPMSTFADLLTGLPEGTDVTETLNVVKWSMPEYESDWGIIIGDKPYNIPTTDETRVQAIPEIIEVMQGKPYYISTKMDGTSITFYNKDGQFGICTRDCEIKDTEDSELWKFAREQGIQEKLKGHNIAIQGELCGPKIQGNKLQLKEWKWFMFNVFDFDTMKYMNVLYMETLAFLLKLETVPIEEIKDSFNYKSIEELLERAKGKYPSGRPKEGIVIRTVQEEENRELGGRLSFKVINNEFLLKEKD